MPQGYWEKPGHMISALWIRCEGTDWTPHLQLISAGSTILRLELVANITRLVSAVFASPRGE